MVKLQISFTDEKAIENFVNRCYDSGMLVPNKNHMHKIIRLYDNTYALVVEEA